MSRAAGNADVQEVRRLAADFYRAWAALGEGFAAVDQADPQVRDQRDAVHPLLVDILDSAEKTELVRKAAASWMAAQRPHNGVIVVGTVLSTAQQGELFETQLELDRERTVTLISVRDPRQSLQPGGSIVLLGWIASRPAENVPGYKGSAESAILDGLHVSRFRQ
jgi:hypothetical protein